MKVAARYELFILLILLILPSLLILPLLLTLLCAYVASTAHSVYAFYNVETALEQKGYYAYYI